MFIGKYDKSVILTYLGVGLSLVGIYLIFNGAINGALICLMYAGICDLFDGKVARMCKRTEEEQAFGVQIDTLADMISFVAFPVIIGLNMIHDIKVWHLLFLLFYMLAGIIRLAWFNMQADINKPTVYYQGLPVTYIALILPVMYMIQLPFSAAVSNLLWLLIYVGVGVLFILNVKIKKPRGLWYGVFSLLAIVLTVLLMAVID